jgi:predicted ABC-type ATPase
MNPINNGEMPHVEGEHAGQIRPPDRKTYLANAFSLNMLDHSAFGYILSVIPLQENDILVERVRNAISAVGHESTARVISERLGVPIKVNRIEVKLNLGDVAIVFQIGRRLNEGEVLSAEQIKALPIYWWRVEVRG